MPNRQTGIGQEGIGQDRKRKKGLGGLRRMDRMDEWMMIGWMDVQRRLIGCKAFANSDSKSDDGTKIRIGIGKRLGRLQGISGNGREKLRYIKTGYAN